MKSRKTTAERIEEIEMKEAQMKALKKQLKQKEAEENRKARNKRLIMIGAEVEKILGKPIEANDLPKLIRFLESQEARGHYSLPILILTAMAVMFHPSLIWKGALICGRSPH